MYGSGGCFLVCSGGAVVFLTDNDNTLGYSNILEHLIL